MMIPIKLEKRTEEEQKAYAEGYAAGKRDAVRHGRWWTPFDPTWFGKNLYACTSCGDALEVPTECGKPMYKFCPYCGARMDLEGKE